MLEVRADAAPAPAAGSLGKHEELPHIGERCTCGPRYLRLLSDQGELVEMRGGCVNQCDYCAKLAAVENCEMLVLDAMAGDAPTVVAILGTRTPTVDMEAFANARRLMVRAVRYHFPGAEYAYEVEFTTGYGPRAGGKRRPHWNWFWKRIPANRIGEFTELVIGLWCKHVDAEPHAQYVAAIRNEVGLTKYVTEHFMKASQRPPKGFTGQRFCCSRGYFGVDLETGVQITAAVARRRARESLRRKRELHKALERGHDAHDAELIAHENYERACQAVWTLVNDRGARVGPIQHDAARMALPSDSGRTVKPLPARVEAIAGQVAGDLVLFKLHDGAIAVSGAQHSGTSRRPGPRRDGRERAAEAGRGRDRAVGRAHPPAPARTPARLAVSPADP